MSEESTEKTEAQVDPLEELTKKVAEAEAKRAELLRAKLAKLEAENKQLEELSNYTFPEQKQTLVTAPVDNYEKDIRDIKQKYDRVIYSVDAGFPVGHPDRQIYRIGDRYNGRSLNDAYLDYKQLVPEERTVDNLKKILPKLF